MKDLTAEQVATLKAIRDAIPAPNADTVFQKVLGQPYFDANGNLCFGQADDYILGHKVKFPGGAGGKSIGQSGDYDPTSVYGSVTVADDTSALSIPQEFWDKLRLDYPGTHFDPGDASVYVMRFKTAQVNKVQPSYNSEMGGTVDEVNKLTDPFTGNGFTKAGDDVIPEYWADGPVRIEDGAEIWEVTESGTQRLVAVFDGVTGTWMPVEGAVV